MPNVTEGSRVIGPDDVDDNGYANYQIQNAPKEAVTYVLSCDETQRSQWVWIRLPDGDLVLAIYPQDDAYFSTEQWRSI